MHSRFCRIKTQPFIVASELPCVRFEWDGQIALSHSRVIGLCLCDLSCWNSIDHAASVALHGAVLAAVQSGGPWGLQWASVPDWGSMLDCFAVVAKHSLYVCFSPPSVSLNFDDVNVLRWYFVSYIVRYHLARLLCPALPYFLNLTPDICTYPSHFFCPHLCLVTHSWHCLLRLVLLYIVSVILFLIFIHLDNFGHNISFESNRK